MIETRFATEWSGSPLVLASDGALNRSALPPECREFFGKVGLPSNACWFDTSSQAILCFDSIACLRPLLETDVLPGTWEAIGPTKRRTILGIWGAAFVVADEHGVMFMVNSRDDGAVVDDPDWQPTMFVNQCVQCFAECLIAYKTVRDVIEREDYDFNRPAIRDAVGAFRRSIEAADPRALADERSFWTQILDDLDVW